MLINEPEKAAKRRERKSERKKEKVKMERLMYKKKR
jgi:hypothetical protein